MAERSLRVDAVFDDDGTGDERPAAVAYAFDQSGALVARAELAKGGAALPLRKDAKRQQLRVLVGPEVGPDTDLAVVRKAGAREAVLSGGAATVTIPPHVWRDWLLCSCVVRGRVVRRVELPDGNVRELPVCNTRVSVYEVDRLPRIIELLPDDLLWRLRDELIEVIVRPPVPRPVPVPPGPFPPGPFPPGPGPDPAPFAAPALDTAAFQQRVHAAEASAKPVSGAQAAAAPVPVEALALRLASDSEQLRAVLPHYAHLLPSLFCRWSWLDVFFRYRIDLVRQVETDADGRFSTVLWYPCHGDHPDVYFRVEQLREGVWHSVYRPPVRCATRWNYQCGSEVVIRVTDPSAEVCYPDEEVEPPAGVGRWVAPLAVGGTWVAGTAGTAQPGWVKPNGRTDYGGIVDAPFATDLAFRLAYDRDLPLPGGITYYRFSYRRVGTGEWVPMTRPVLRYYEVPSASGLPSYNAYALGPKTQGGTSALYEFRPHQDPNGNPWPAENHLGDIFHAYLDTRQLPGGPQTHGDLEVRVEVFDAAGALVLPGAGTFRFLFPETASSASVTTRLAQASEIVDGGVVFRLRVDNRPCVAEIESQRAGGAVANDCGMLSYSGGDVELRFRAAQPGGDASFAHTVLRKSTPVQHSAGLVTQTPVGPFALAGGWYSGSVSGASLLGGCGTAAFSEHVYVHAHATNGWSRIAAYDSSAVMAFALAP